MKKEGSIPKLEIQSTKRGNNYFMGLHQVLQLFPGHSQRDVDSAT